jgi:hypothetical protein
MSWGCRKARGELALRRALRRWGRAWRSASAGRRATAHRLKHPALRFGRCVALWGLRLRPAQLRPMLELLVTGVLIVWEQLRSRWGLR